MTSAAADLPSWVMLDRFVFRRDDDDGSFPDDDAAPMRASSFTSRGEPFTVALLPAAPPAVSRLYERWPPQHVCAAISLITAHQGLFVIRALSETTEVATSCYRQDFFVFRTATAAAGANSWIKRLPDPECIEPIVTTQGRRQVAQARWFDPDTVGVVFGSGAGNEDEYFAVVVQLAQITKAFHNALALNALS
jgi:hypothetical protein